VKKLASRVHAAFTSMCCDIEVKVRAIFCALLFVIPVSASAADRSSVVFSVVMTRHGVRSAPKEQPAYQWPDWSPVGKEFLTAHGYRLMTYMGQFYRTYFASLGDPMMCTQLGTYVYADIDQRTLETARALIDGACGSSNAVAIYHVQPGTKDGLFDGAGWLGAAGKIDAGASSAAVAAAAPHPPSAIVAQHAADFSALQRLLDTRCATTCPPASDGESTIDGAKGLAELRGPLADASGDAESLFLEYAQCQKLPAALEPAAFLQSLQGAMRLHVLAYDVNARNAYNPLVRGGNIFAHIVGLLEEKAGMPHPGVDVPDVTNDNVAFLVGHDTQLGALGGILDAHWSPGGGIVDDDMPPGGGMIFELYRGPQGDYRVRLRFASQTFAQMRRDEALPGGANVVPVSFDGCSGAGCSISLTDLAAKARDLAQRGFVQKHWTPNTDDAVDLAPLADPPWTHCE
jgi:4-phytase / acid phosphatase